MRRRRARRTAPALRPPPKPASRFRLAAASHAAEPVARIAKRRPDPSTSRSERKTNMIHHVSCGDSLCTMLRKFARTTALRVAMVAILLPVASASAAGGPGGNEGVDDRGAVRLLKVIPVPVSSLNTHCRRPVLVRHQFRRPVDPDLLPRRPFESGRRRRQCQDGHLPNAASGDAGLSRVSALQPARGRQ